MESFELTMTKLCSGQEISIKINQRGVIHKRNKVVTVLCTALQTRTIAVSDSYPHHCAL